MLKINGYQKLTLLDYPGHLACILFTQGCNFACPYCHNSELIQNTGLSSVEQQEILQYLDKRKGILEGVVISGGEPLIHNDIVDLLRKIKTLGLKIKLDTNGTNPVLLKRIIDEKLVDYIAMDIKNSPDKYELTCGISHIFIGDIMQCIVLIQKSGIDHEFRTTVVDEFHTLQDIETILKMIGSTSKYYIQNFQNSENVLNHNLHSFSDEKLNLLKDTLGQKYQNLVIR